MVKKRSGLYVMLEINVNKKDDEKEGSDVMCS